MLCCAVQALAHLPLGSKAFRNCMELAVQMVLPDAEPGLMRDLLEAGLVQVGMGVHVCMHACYMCMQAPAPAPAPAVRG